MLVRLQEKVYVMYSKDSEAQGREHAALYGIRIDVENGLTFVFIAGNSSSHQAFIKFVANRENGKIEKKKMDEDDFERFKYALRIRQAELNEKDSKVVGEVLENLDNAWYSGMKIGALAADFEGLKRI